MSAGAPDEVVESPLPAPHAAHHAQTGHSHETHAAAYDAESTSPQRRACPHCPLATAANVDHGACVATESPEHGGFVPVKDTSDRPQLAFAPNWLLPAARAAPPLIARSSRQAAPRVAVSITTAFCVLLI